MSGLGWWRVPGAIHGRGRLEAWWRHYNCGEWTPATFRQGSLDLEVVDHLWRVLPSPQLARMKPCWRMMEEMDHWSCQASSLIIDHWSLISQTRVIAEGVRALWGLLTIFCKDWWSLLEQWLIVLEHAGGNGASWNLMMSFQLMDHRDEVWTEHAGGFRYLEQKHYKHYNLPKQS